MLQVTPWQLVRWLKENAEDPKNKLLDIYSEIKSGVKSVLYYLPVIWKSRPYDHAYCLKLYIHSLKRLQKDLNNFPYSDLKKEVKELDLIIKMLSLYNRDEDLPSTKKELKELLKNYNLKETDLSFDFNNKREVKPGLYSLKFKYESILDKEAIDQFRAQYSNLYKNDYDKKRNYFKKALILIYQKSMTFWS